MVPSAAVVAALRAGGVSLFTGVPDSLLRDFCAWVTDHVPSASHVICANEGNAVALAAGHHLATGELGLVYLQNSGQGNTINPLLSLTDATVYSIPMVLLIGWRGQPGHRDEPQHLRQGALTTGLLQTLGVPWSLLPSTGAEDAEGAIEYALRTARVRSAPFALLVSKGTFEPYALQSARRAAGALAREVAIGAVLDHLTPADIVVGTTGKASRELYELRERRSESSDLDFLTVGSMGHASHIALGMASARPEARVVCLDGDGAVLMHMGALATIGARRPANLRHIVLNNGAHDSVGGQPTVALDIDLVAVARACGYPWAARADDAATLAARLPELLAAPGPGLLEVRVARGAREDLGRPTAPPLVRKAAFMARLGVGDDA